jgi:SnoaL-like domain
MWRPNQPPRKEALEMTVQQESPAVAVALAHVEAWSNHDFDAARKGVAEDVKVTATTTQPFTKDTNLSGVEDYMRGLKEFAQTVVPGSLTVNASLGDERNGLLMVTVQAALGPGGEKVTLPAARLYVLDEQDKIRSCSSRLRTEGSRRAPSAVRSFVFKVGPV